MIGSAATTGEHENETARLLKYDRGTTKNIRNYLHQDDTHKDTLRVFAQVQALTLIIPGLRDIGAQVVPLSEVGMLGAYIKRFGNAVSKGDTSALRSQDRSCDGESAFRFSGNFTSSVSSEESDRELAKKLVPLSPALTEIRRTSRTLSGPLKELRLLSGESSRSVATSWSNGSSEMTSVQGSADF